jgi:hypothetical protein
LGNAGLRITKISHFRKKFSRLKSFSFLCFQFRKDSLFQPEIGKQPTRGLRSSGEQDFSEESFAFLSIAPKNTPFLRFFPTK